MDQSRSRVRLNFLDSSLEVLRHFIHGTAHWRCTLRIVLEIAEHLREVLRPGFQLWSIFDWDSQHLRSDRVGEGFGEIRNHIHAAFGHHGIEQHLHDVSDVIRSEEHTSELQSKFHLVCRLLLEKKKKPQTGKKTTHKQKTKKKKTRHNKQN